MSADLLSLKAVADRRFREVVMLDPAFTGKKPQYEMPLTPGGVYSAQTLVIRIYGTVLMGGHQWTPCGIALADGLDYNTKEIQTIANKKIVVKAACAIAKYDTARIMAESSRR